MIHDNQDSKIFSKNKKEKWHALSNFIPAALTLACAWYKTIWSTNDVPLLLLRLMIGF